MKVTVLVAADLDGGIGHEGTIPWRCSRDLKHFKEKTLGKVVIMGRKTVESLPFKLKDRYVIMLSRTLERHKRADLVVPSLGEAIALFYDTKEIIIAGGAEVYNEALRDFADEVYLSTMMGFWPCDTFLTPMSMHHFDRRETVFYPEDDKDPPFAITHFIKRK